jgi:site-specific recombinase XerD
MGERYNFFQIEAEFRKYLSAENVSGPTIKNYCADLRYFFSWIQFTYGIDAIALSDMPNYIDSSSLHAFHSYLESDTNAVATAKRRFSTIHKFCSFCIKQGWLTENPAKLSDDRQELDEKKKLVHAYVTDLKNKNISIDSDYCTSTLSEFLNY